MTDQKQAPEREVIEFLRFGFTDPSRANVVEALAKQRDELAAHRDKLERDRDYFFDRAKKAEAERDEANKTSDEHLNARHIAETERDQALAESAAREISMRDRAAEVVRKHLGPNPFCQEEIRALPPSPDGQQALDDLLTNAWEGGYYHQGPYTDNPHRKK